MYALSPTCSAIFRIPAGEGVSGENQRVNGWDNGIYKDGTGTERRIGVIQ